MYVSLTCYSSRVVWCTFIYRNRVFVLVHLVRLNDIFGMIPSFSFRLWIGEALALQASFLGRVILSSTKQTLRCLCFLILLRHQEF